MTEKAISRNAQEVCQHLELEPESRALLTPEMKPPEFIALLREHECDRDALQVLANWLPKREAVWWGCLCSWLADRAQLTTVEDEALGAAVHWVQEPNEEHRRIAGSLADRAGLDTLAGGVAKAVFWSGGSMNPPNLPAVEPPLTLCAIMLGRALLARTLKAPAETRLRNDIYTLGFHVVQGKIPVSPER